MKLIKVNMKSKMIKNFLLFFVTILACELIFSLVSGNNIFSVSTIRIMAFVTMISLLLSFLCSLLKKKTRNIISIIILFIIATYMVAQLGFISYLGVYASLNATSQLGAVKDYIIDFIKSFEIQYFTIYIPVILASILIIFNKEMELNYSLLSKKTKLFNNFKKLSITLFIFLLISIFYNITLTSELFKNSNQTTSLIDLFNNPSLPTTSVSNFGVLGFAYTDIKSKVFGITESTDILNVGNPNEVEPTEYLRTFDDTAWLDLISTEKNTTYNAISNYLINNESTSTNEYTGLFEGMNVIFVMMESVNDMILMEEHYPNFSKLMDNSWYFENFFSPRNSCPTGNNEFSGMTSLYSIYNNCTANTYKDNIYPQSVFGLFKDLNYNAVTMHNYTEGYYYRRTIHTNMGADIHYRVQDLDIRYSNIYQEWASDADLGEKSMEIMINDHNALTENFVLWLTTVSAHQPYSVSSIEGDLYYDYFKTLGHSVDMTRYMSKVKVTDDMFGILLEELETNGLADNTVIVVYNDHYPYGLYEKELGEVLDRPFGDYDEDRVPFLIYHPSIEGEVISDYTTYMNIFPTVANLFGMDYDPRLYFGKDVFSPEFESRAVFSDGSWINEYAIYDATNGDIEYLAEKVYTEDELLYINAEISNELKMSSLIIKNDYFNYLFNALEKEN